MKITELRGVLKKNCWKFEKQEKDDKKGGFPSPLICASLAIQDEISSWVEVTKIQKYCLMNNQIFTQ